MHKKNYLITGVPGSGKTTVCEALQSRGMAAYDADSIDGLIRWEDTEGEPSKTMDDPPKDWFEHNSWNINEEKLQDYLNTDENFICVIASNQDKFYGLFDKIFLLKIDEQTLRERLTTRTNNSFGRHPNQLADILSWFDWFQSDLEKRGAVIIDALKPLNAVTDQILYHSR